MTERADDPEAQIQRAIDIRLDWGLEHDRAWVEQVQADPASVVSELGILVTRDELAVVAEQLASSERGPLIAYGYRNHASFGGLWVEGARVVMCFTGDLDAHRAALAQLAPDQPVEVRHCANTEAELRAIQGSIDWAALRGQGIEVMTVSLDTINNVVVVEAKSNLPNAKAILEGQHPGRLVAEIFPLPGAWQHTSSGAGWRLLMTATTRGQQPEPYSVDYAADENAWHELWSSVGGDGPPPAVDMTTELVAMFAEGIGSSCPEVRLDGVVIDHAGRRVFAVKSDPLAPRACTADLAGSAVFVIALAREALPESPFTLSLSERPICDDCPDQMTVDLR